MKKKKDSFYAGRSASWWVDRLTCEHHPVKQTYTDLYKHADDYLYARVMTKINHHQMQRNYHFCRLPHAMVTQIRDLALKRSTKAPEAIRKDSNNA